MPHYPSHTDVGNNTVTIQNQPFSNPNPANMNAPSVINNNFGLRNSSYGITNNPMAQTQQTGTPTTGSGFNMSNFLTAASPYLGVASAGMGLLSGIMNKPKDINQDFNFDLADSQYNTNQGLTDNMNSLSGLGQNFGNTYKDMMNPYGSYNQNMYQNLRQNVSDTAMQNTNQMNSAMAARGMMGMGNVYDSINSRQAGDQYAQGMQGIQSQSANLAGQFGQMSMGAYGQAGNLAGQADARQLQNTQFNTQNQNDYNQYLKMSSYNQQVQNQNAKGSWGNNMSNNLFGLAGGFFGMGKTK
tara:strand:+ start:495 stop:1391 length:897 start_codon:yes stop_codon:yes gene_type:complete